MVSFRAVGALLVAGCVSAALGSACRSNQARDRAPASASAQASQSPLPVALAGLSGADRGAQQQIRDAYAALTAQLEARGSTAAARSAAYGELGKLFMAAELDAAAEPCFLNAIALTPDDPRWTYYLAQLYRRQGDLPKAADNFRRTVTLQPGNVAAHWWLATVYLDLGRPADAEEGFSRALSWQPGALSAVYGLGRAALARSNYAKAVEYLERVLAMNERAAAAHYPLALAYRGLGRMQEAEAHMARRSHMEILPVDPLMNELDGLLHSVTAYQDRGMRASRSGDWEEAATQFGRAVEVSPDNVEARLDLSTALYRTGDAAGALAQAREALRLAPHDPRVRSRVRSLSQP